MPFCMAIPLPLAKSLTHPLLCSLALSFLVGDRLVTSLAFEGKSFLLFVTELVANLTAEVDDTPDALLFCLLAVLVFELANTRDANALVELLVGVVELKHVAGGAMRVIPDELLWFIEVLGLGNLRLWCWLGSEDGFEFMALQG